MSTIYPNCRDCLHKSAAAEYAQQYAYEYRAAGMNFEAAVQAVRDKYQGQMTSRRMDFEAEMAAVKHGIRPADWTETNITRWRRQFERLGMPFDWDAEVTTCKPEYYRWTQWLFLQLYKNGLA